MIKVDLRKSLKVYIGGEVETIVAEAISVMSSVYLTLCSESDLTEETAAELLKTIPERGIKISSGVTRMPDTAEAAIKS